MQTPTPTHDRLADILDQYPAAASSLPILMELAEAVMHESMGEPRLDGIVLDLLLLCRKINVVLASLSASSDDQTAPQRPLHH